MSAVDVSSAIVTSIELNLELIIPKHLSAMHVCCMRVLRREELVPFVSSELVRI